MKKNLFVKAEKQKMHCRGMIPFYLNLRNSEASVIPLIMFLDAMQETSQNKYITREAYTLYIYPLLYKHSVHTYNYVYYSLQVTRC